MVSRFFGHAPKDQPPPGTEAVGEAIVPDHFLAARLEVEEHKPALAPVAKFAVNESRQTVRQSDDAQGT
jgi:hypothetical protein